MLALQYLDSMFPFKKLNKHGVVELPDTDRATLAQILSQLNFNLGAEVGVERGIYSQVLCEANPNLHLYAVDLWTAYDGYRDHATQHEMDEIMEEAKKRLFPYSCELIRKDSIEAASEFSDESLDFVYIDANHEFRHVVDDISAWWPKVKIGGIVAGHDYIKRTDPGYLMHVIPAVHGFVEAYDIKPLFVLGTKERTEGEKRDDIRSWFFVKTKPHAIRPGWKPS